LVPTAYKNIPMYFYSTLEESDGGVAKQWDIDSGVEINDLDKRSLLPSSLCDQSNEWML
jgi:hypothetical protein